MSAILEKYTWSIDPNERLRYACESQPSTHPNHSSRYFQPEEDLKCHRDPVAFASIREQTTHSGVHIALHLSEEEPKCHRDHIALAWIRKQGAHLGVHGAYLSRPAA